MVGLRTRTKQNLGKGGGQQHAKQLAMCFQYNYSVDKHVEQMSLLERNFRGLPGGDLYFQSNKEINKINIFCVGRNVEMKCRKTGFHFL